MAGDAFTDNESMIGASKVQKMNQKTRFRGTGAEISAMSGNDGPHPGQIAFCSSTGSGFTVDRTYERDNADTAWQETFDNATGQSPDSKLLNGIAGGVADSVLLIIPSGSNGQVLTRSSGNVVYATPLERTPLFLEPSRAFLHGSAALFELESSTEGNGGFYLGLSATTDWAKWQTVIPPDVTSITALCFLDGEGTAIDFDVSTRSTTAGEDPEDEGQADSVQVSTTPAGNTQVEHDISAAFDTSGIADPGNLLSIETRPNDTNPIRIMGIKLTWVT